MKTINEIQNLLSLVSNHNTDGLRQFLLSNSQKPLIAVGSGGMDGVARFAALLYGSVSGLGRGMTPLEMNSLSDETLSKVKVLLLSAGGHNSDIEFAAKRCLSVNPSDTACICLSSSERNKLMPLFEKAGASAHDFRFEAHSHDGFVSCGTPIIYCALLAKAFGADVTDTELSRQFAERYHLRTNSDKTWDITSISGIRHFTILHGSWGTPVANLLEGKFTESGWATCQVADFRNYCHGRFIFTSNHLEDSAVVLLISPREKHLAEKIRSFLPESARLIIIETAQDSPAATLDLLVSATGFFQTGCDAAGVNPESPKNIGKIDKRVPMWIPFVAELKKIGPLKMKHN